MGGKRNRFQWQILGLVFVFSINIESNTLDLSLKNHKEYFEKVALNLWEVAELGYQEYESSNILADSLSHAGFKITKGVAGIPTAFVAEYGSKGPVIGILGEFDALPGLSQTTSPFREKADNNSGAGQACGHHLFGAGSAWAAVAVKECLRNIISREGLDFMELLLKKVVVEKFTW